MSKVDQAIRYIETPGNARRGNLCTYALAAHKKGRLGVIELPLHTNAEFHARIAQAVEDMRAAAHEGFLLIAGDDVLEDDVENARHVLQSLAVGIAKFALEKEDTKHHRKLLVRAVTGEETLGERRAGKPQTKGFNPMLKGEEFYATGQSSHYEDWHPRHFPSVAVAMVSKAVVKRILETAPAAAEKVKEKAKARRGLDYFTTAFFID